MSKWTYERNKHGDTWNLVTREPKNHNEIRQFDRNIRSWERAKAPKDKK